MKASLRKLAIRGTIWFIGLSLTLPLCEARGRNNGNNGGNYNRPSPTANAPRPGNNGQRPGNNGQRPGNNGQRPGNNGQRPGNNGQRPGNNGPRPGDNGQRPGNNGQRPGNNGQRPGNNGPRPGNNGPRPGNNGPRPGNNWNRPDNHGPRPGSPDNKFHHGSRPNGPGHNRPPYRPNFHRPQLPPPRPFTRPAPPPMSWRPTVVWPRFNTILGVTLGSALDISINLLLNSGYNVNAYGNNCVYLTNVPMLNFYWPDATLYYGANGGLTSGSFIYSTPVFNLTRYQNTYANLINIYGNPYQVSNNGSNFSATWWGDNQFITLSFRNAYANDGCMRYFTTLSFGN